MRSWPLLPVVAILLVPAPASAKGPTAVEVVGPGIARQTVTETWRRGDVDVFGLADASNLWGTPGFRAARAPEPVGAAGLGPRYVLTWRVGRAVLGVSHAYPFAVGGPVTHHLDQAGTTAGRRSGPWWRVGPRLRRQLERLGARRPVVTANGTTDGVHALALALGRAAGLVGRWA